MEEFVVIVRDYLAANSIDEFTVDIIEAEDSEKAWEVVEEEYATNNSQEWLLSLYELRELKLLLNNIKLELLTTGDLKIVGGKR